MSTKTRKYRKLFRPKPVSLKTFALVGALVLSVFLTNGCAPDAGIGPIPEEPGGRKAPPNLREVSFGLPGRLQAISVPAPEVVWVSGVEGTWARSLDAGRTWQSGIVPGAQDLEFRDVEAIDSQRAWLLASGAGPASRIYFTEDGGATWALQFQNAEPAAFYDCLASWDPKTAAVFSDSVDGEFLIRRTTDGRTWHLLDPARLPEAQPGEGGFAASGDCLISVGGKPGEPDLAGHGLIVMGNADEVRVLRSTDGGASWQVRSTPMVGGEAIGLTAIALDPGTGFGVAVGGSIGDAEGPPTVLVTHDAGLTFEVAQRPAMAGALYGVALSGKGDQVEILAVGPGGVAWSPDRAATWELISTRGAWSVHFAPSGLGVLVGPAGYVAMIEATSQ